MANYFTGYKDLELFSRKKLMGVNSHSHVSKYSNRVIILQI